MPAPASTDELTDIILKSGVIEEPRLRAYLAKLVDPPADLAKLGGLMVRDGILTYFQAEQLLQGKWKRFFIGKYKVLEKLGVGGMGQVFLCEHKLMKRRVAVKVLPVAKAQDPASLQRFYREARAVAAVDHPNIVRAYDIDEDGGLHFLVMEFVDGSNLHDLVKRHGPMEVLRACHYIYGSAVGLHHAAEKGLLHRDIKPANILVDRTGVVKILDLGLARFFNPEEDDMLTKKFDENVLGTADYLAPEQALDSHDVDIRADIYGLGGTFYYMLTGSPPFAEGSIAQKLLWHQTKEPRAIRDLRPDVPAELVKIVAKMMAKNAADRFQSPADLMAALGPWVQTPIGPPPFAEMPQFSVAAVGPPRPGTGSGAPLHTGAVTATPRPAAPPAAPAYTPAPAAAPLVMLAPPPLPAGWESFGADTLANAQTDTRRTRADADDALDDDRPARRRKGSRSALRPPPRNGGKGWVYIVAGVALLAVVAGALVVLKPWQARDTGIEKTPPSAEAAKWYVSASGTGPTPGRTQKTLAEAVKSARAGETIVLLDDRFEGPAVIVPQSAKNVRIEAGNAAKSVVWSYKPDGPTPAQGVLDLRSAEGVTVEGLTVEVNGLHDTGVQVSGFCKGTTLDRVTVRNAKATGFRLHNIEAEGKALRLAGCRATGCPVGVSLDASGRLANKNVVVEGCRFDGVETALRLDGAAEAVEFKNNRLFNVARGVLWATAVPPGDKVQVTVERNTFHTVREAGLKFDAPLAGGRQELVFARNYFAATAALAVGPPSAGLKATDNGMDAASKDGTLPLKPFPVDVPFAAAALNPNEDVTFLRPAGRLSAVGPNKVAVGAE